MSVCALISKAVLAKLARFSVLVILTVLVIPEAAAWSLQGLS